MASTHLDIHHITAVCDRAADRTGITGYAINDIPTGVRVRAPSTAAAGLLETALTRVGYTVDRPRYFGRRDELTIPGWSHDHLTVRITALREQINHLDASRRETAASAIDRAAGPTTGHNVLTDVIRELRDHAEARAGVFAPTNPRAEQPDPDLVRLLRTVRRLEHHITERIQRHAITADLAVRLYARYRQHTSDHHARTAAIHDAYLAGCTKPITHPEHRSHTRPTADPAGADTTAPPQVARDFPTTVHEAAARAGVPGAPRPTAPGPTAPGPPDSQRRAR